MRIRIFSPLPVILLFLVFGSSVVAQPKIQFPGGTSYDFGNIYRGEGVAHTFLVKNAGKDTLVISGVSTSCGCTAALVSSPRLAPDSSTQVKVTFSSSGYLGVTHKTVTITSNDTTAPVSTITITSNVRLILEAQPYNIFFASAKVDSLAETSVKLKNVTDKPVRILSTRRLMDGLELEIVGKKFLNPGDSTQLKAEFKPTQEGTKFGNAIVVTDFKPQSEVVLNVNANVRK